MLTVTLPAVALVVAASCADDGAGAPLKLAGTWSGTRAEGAQAFPVSLEPGLSLPMDHVTTGALTLTFVETGADTFTGDIDIDADICWWAGLGGSTQFTGALDVVTVNGDRIDFEYTSNGGVTAFAAPYPPNPVWSGSYDSIDCPGPGGPTWDGNFSVFKQ